jgi:hypothetical protein
MTPIFLSVYRGTYLRCWLLFLLMIMFFFCCVCFSMAFDLFYSFLFFLILEEEKGKKTKFESPAVPGKKKKNHLPR